MSKVLVADDSLTIQKIIKITLSQYFDEVKMVSTQDELLNQVSTREFPIVLLDYSLSNEMDGFDLSLKIKEKFPDIKILMLFGTFDIIDQEKIKTFRIESHLVKPFDGKDLVDLCLFLDNGEDLNEAKAQDLFEGEDSSEVLKEEDDQWVVASAVEDEIVTDNYIEPDKNDISSSFENGDETSKEHAIEEEMKSWGVAIPPRNQPEEAILTTTENAEDEISYPDDNDLEYPDLEFTKKSDDQIPENVSEDITPPHEDINFSDEAYKLSADLISEEDLGIIEEHTPGFDEISEDHANPEKEFLENTGTFSFIPDKVNLSDDSQHSVNLEKEIRDEISSEDFWVTEKNDDEEDSFIKSDVVDPKEEEFAGLQDVTKEITQQLNDMRPEIEALVKTYCKEVIEKSVWKLVPEIAERIIKTELEKLSQETKNEN